MSILKDLKDIANILRRDVLEATTIIGSGHPSSCLSCAEIMSVLFFHQIQLDIKNPENLDNDEFILSKGHAAPILYAALYRANLINHHPLSLRKLKSPLEGHPIPSLHLPWIKVATGSLGQGLSIGVGMALASKLQNLSSKIYVLLGDSETTEGSIYEALQLASHYQLNNLIIIIDVNRLGQTGPTILQHNLKAYRTRLKSFGWNVITINGHKINHILKALKKASNSTRSTAIMAKTIKGKGFSLIEDQNNWHGKALNKEQLKKALEEIPNQEMPKIKINYPENTNQRIIQEKHKLIIPHLTTYHPEDQVATRQAYGNALANLAKLNREIIAIDGEVSNSTNSEEVKKIAPKQFIEAYIAEQNMIGMALGLSKKGFNVFASTFAAFLTRAHDHIRMVALSNPNLTICGSHVGVSIGEDGASQMGLEDITLFRSIPNSIIFYPCDATSTEKLTYLSAQLPNIKYIRTTRPRTPIIYHITEPFPLGEFKILKQSNKDKAVLIGSGVTLHESLKAHDILKQNKINTAVIDLYCIKPLNTTKLIKFIQKHGNKTVITEDHYKEGGIGETIISSLKNTNIKLAHLAIEEIPHSGKTDELLDKYKISAKHIAKAARSL